MLWGSALVTGVAAFSLWVCCMYCFGFLCMVRLVGFHVGSPVMFCMVAGFCSRGPAASWLLLFGFYEDLGTSSSLCCDALGWGDLFSLFLYPGRFLFLHGTVFPVLSSGLQFGVLGRLCILSGLGLRICELVPC